ncbi:MAG: DEAD/DEAH box helicase [Duncaniella sp.]|nr:DEAD/DEAH box helicase [Duncaniella sp.]HBI58496.1 ATP-dependent RNA helicase [Porphyromonadaceae bacterium]
MKFEDLDLSYDVLDALDAMAFDECTPIQEQTIPVILDGHDLVACAQTGTGKTAAYLLPVIDSIADGHLPDDAINCIVMAPTRELVQQIDRQMEGFAYFLPVSSLAIYGGTDGAEFSRQQRGLKMGADVVIATPGRLLDHIQMGYVDLSRVTYFILDEADRMLDMGFYDDIMQIVKRLPADRQTLLFSATMPVKTRRLAEEILTDPVEVSIAISRPTEKIDQSAYVCHDSQKTGILKHIFKTRSSKRVIIFASSKLAVKELTRELRSRRYKAAEMHSDLEQQQRNEVIHDFTSGKIDILVATDILARGIDIDEISMVINYNVPREAEDYIHRIGRTARANADGTAITLVNRQEQEKFGRIEKFLGYEIKKNEVPAELGETPAYTPERKSDRRGGNRNQGRRGGNPRGRKDRPAPSRDKKKPQETTDAATTSPQPNRQQPKRRRNNRRNKNNNGSKNPSSRTEQ